MCRRVACWFLFVLGALVFCPSALLAGHYHLEDLVSDQFLSAEEVTACASQGVMTSEELLTRLSTAKGRKAFAKVSKLDRKRLDELVIRLELMQIKGIGPTMVRLLQAAGVTDAKKLSRQKAAPLFTRLVSTNDELHLSPVSPPAEVLSDWIKASAARAVVVKD